MLSMVASPPASPSAAAAVAAVEQVPTRSSSRHSSRRRPSSGSSSSSSSSKGKKSSSASSKGLSEGRGENNGGTQQHQHLRRSGSGGSGKSRSSSKEQLKTPTAATAAAGKEVVLSPPTARAAAARRMGSSGSMRYIMSPTAKLLSRGSQSARKLAGRTALRDLEFSSPQVVPSRSSSSSSSSSSRRGPPSSRSESVLHASGAAGGTHKRKAPPASGSAASVRGNSSSSSSSSGFGTASRAARMGGTLQRLGGTLGSAAKRARADVRSTFATASSSSSSSAASAAAAAAADAAPVGCFFGVPLTVAMGRERARWGAAAEVPRFIEDAIVRLQQPDALAAEGLFRLSADHAELQALRADIDAGTQVDLSTRDAHTVACLIKQYIRELPAESLFPERMQAGLQGAVTDADGECVGVANADVAALREALRQLPTDNWHLLHRLTRLMHQISANAEVNKMTPGNLAITTAPNLIKRSTPLTQEARDAAAASGIGGGNAAIAASVADALAAAASAAQNTHVVEALIVNFDQCFPDGDAALAALATTLGAGLPTTTPAPPSTTTSTSSAAAAAAAAAAASTAGATQATTTTTTDEFADLREFAFDLPGTGAATPATDVSTDSSSASAAAAHAAAIAGVSLLDQIAFDDDDDDDDDDDE